MGAKILIPRAFVGSLKKIYESWPDKGNSWTRMEARRLEELFLQELAEWIRTKDPAELLDVMNLAGMLYDVEMNPDPDNIKNGIELRDLLSSSDLLFEEA